MPLFNPVFTSGEYLAPPTAAVYAPATQTFLTAGSVTFAVPGLSTTVAGGSNGGEISTIASWASPSGGVLSVAAGGATPFPSTGSLLVGATGGANQVALVTYTGTSGGNSFTGCAYVSGAATSTLVTGNLVTQVGATPQISTGAFVAPASGSVVVTASFVQQANAASSAIAFALAAHGTVTPLIGNAVQFKSAGANLAVSSEAVFPVTGLTAGTSYNFDLLACVATGNIMSIIAFGQTATTPSLGNAGAGAPVTMTVQAV